MCAAQPSARAAGRQRPPAARAAKPPSTTAARRRGSAGMAGRGGCSCTPPGAAQPSARAAGRQRPPAAHGVDVHIVVLARSRDALGAGRRGAAPAAGAGSQVTGALAAPSAARQRIRKRTPRAVHAQCRAAARRAGRAAARRGASSTTEQSAALSGERVRRARAAAALRGAAAEAQRGGGYAARPHLGKRGLGVRHCVAWRHCVASPRGLSRAPQRSALPPAAPPTWRGVLTSHHDAARERAEQTRRSLAFCASTLECHVVTRPPVPRTPPLRSPRVTATQMRRVESV
jgi:hypothetical protein